MFESNGHWSRAAAANVRRGVPLVCVRKECGAVGHEKIITLRSQES